MAQFCFLSAHRTAFINISLHLFQGNNTSRFIFSFQNSLTVFFGGCSGAFRVISVLFSFYQHENPFCLTSWRGSVWPFLQLVYKPPSHLCKASGPAVNLGSQGLLLWPTFYIITTELGLKKKKKTILTLPLARLGGSYFYQRLSINNQFLHEQRQPGSRAGPRALASSGRRPASRGPW